MVAPVLNRKLTLETPRRSPDGAGGYQVQWEALGTIWGALDARSGNDATAISAQLSKARYQITVRAAPVGSPRRPRPDQRLREGNRLFQIAAVTEDSSDHRFLICHATEEIVT